MFNLLRFVLARFSPAACLVMVFVCVVAQPAIVAGEDPAVAHANSLSRAFRSAAGKVSPAVVTILAKVKQRTPGGRGQRFDPNDLFDNDRLPPQFPRNLTPFEFPRQRPPAAGVKPAPQPPVKTVVAGIGSGVIIDPTGTVLTNNHVVEEADEITVRLSDGREFAASDIRRDPLSDLAVLRIRHDKPLPTARLGDSSKLATGDWVIAIGSPFELETTVSAGIISGKGRSIRQIERGKLLQTDAAINPGNSGGPLVTLTGHVIGVNTAIASVSGGYQGIGFAVPINRARWIVRELLKHGKVRRAYMGIAVEPLDAEKAAAARRPPRSAVYVMQVRAGSPAARAGLQKGDLIIDFAGQRIFQPRDLQDVVEQKPLRSVQSMTIQRQGVASVLKVTVEALPSGVAQSPATRR